MNSSAEQNPTGEATRRLSIRRSNFLRVVPLIVWLLVVFIPLLIGNSFIFSTKEQQFATVLSGAQHQLITRAKEFEARLGEEKLIKSKVKLVPLALADYETFKTRNYVAPLLEYSLIKALPDFAQSMPGQLQKLSRFFADEYHCRPVYLLALDEDPQKCAYLFNKRFAFDPAQDQLFREELASICRFLGEKSNFAQDPPRPYKRFDRFRLYLSTIGVFYFFNTHFFQIDNAFSGKLNERLYQTILRLPGPPGKSNYVLAGITFNQFNRKMLLKQTCRDLSNDNIKISFGQSNETDLPSLKSTSDSLILLTELPATLRSGKGGRGLENAEDKRMVVSFSYDISARRRNLELAHTKNRFTLSLIGLISLFFALLISFERLRANTQLSRIIGIAFFANMCLPLTGLIWTGVSHSIINKEHSTRNIALILEQKIREAELSMFLQRYRQQLLFTILARKFAETPVKKWGEITRKFAIGNNSRPFKQHINNFYLFTSSNKELYRGQLPEESFRQNELPKVFGGPARRLLLQSGTFSHLPESERNKIAQLADFTSGVMEQIIDTSFINSLWRDPGGLTYAAILARRDMFSAHFIRQKQKLAGIMVLGTDNLLTLDIVSEMMLKGLYRQTSTVQGYNIDLAFYPINDFHERQLRGRVGYGYHARNYSEDKDYFLANALFANSDANQLNNLHLDPPHLIVTNSIFEKNIFVVAKAVPANNQFSGTGLPILLAVLALCSCLSLASGVARILLLPIPPLLRAIRELGMNRFSWNLNLKTGDEFGQLISSINEMRTRLLERQKIMQLVSRSAIEAAKTSLGNQRSAQKRQATILFSDIRGFTTISENNSAEDVVAMLNRYFTLMCPAIEKQGGFVDKLIGDAIQAVFYGDNDQQRVLSACKAAMEMRRNLGEFNHQRQQQNLFTINNGIGIASGLVTTGLVGSNTGKLEAAIMGEALNNASVLEANSKHAKNTQILLDSKSCAVIEQYAIFERLLIKEDGNIVPQEICELIRIKDD